MATDVIVSISDKAIISALNTPGGGVFEWRDKVALRVKARAETLAPVNDPLNALHRGAVVGVYRSKFRWDRIGSNQHRVRARIENTAPHAGVVEFGREGSIKFQQFSWTEWGGDIRDSPTHRREGQHVMERAIDQVAVFEGV